MAITLNIAGTVIDFPESASSPLWSTGIIEFAKATEEALRSVAGAFDVAAQTQIIDSYNTASNIDIPNLSFPVSDVRSFTVKYAVSRQSSLESVVESGELEAVYSANNSIGSKWEMSQSSTADAKILFNVTDTGQVQFSTTALSGSSHTGVISYQGKAILKE